MYFVPPNRFFSVHKYWTHLRADHPVFLSRALPINTTATITALVRRKMAGTKNLPRHSGVSFPAIVLAASLKESRAYSGSSAAPDKNDGLSNVDRACQCTNDQPNQGPVVMIRGVGTRRKAIKIDSWPRELNRLYHQLDTVDGRVLEIELGRSIVDKPQ
jgi:hypothetical protein